MTSDPQMIEVAAFPALVIQPRDKVTSPLGALWLQGFGEGMDMGGTGAGLCWERCCNLSAWFGPEDMLAGHKKRWVVTLSGLQLVSLWMDFSRVSSHSCNLNDSLPQFFDQTCRTFIFSSFLSTCSKHAEMWWLVVSL